MIKEGLAGFLNSKDKNSQDFNRELSELNSKLIPVRVLDIILDDTHPKFKQYGEWNGIGTIEFEEVSNNQLIPSNNSIAIPLNSNIKNYPLINEIVLLFLLPSKNLNKINNSQTYYYLNSINLWNHPHHNAFPDVVRYEVLKDSQVKDYEDIEGGSIRRVKDGSTEINLNSPKVGGTFKEKTNIRPLLPFAGDVIYEGRFGNSIRFGNTSKSKSILYKNNWSGTGENGDPITIIRNGQSPLIEDEGWVPTLEDVNRDLTSIWMTSYQTIPLNLNNENYRAFEKPPTQINNYDRPQIIVNSGRVVFNSWEDFILFISKKGIAFSANEDIGISTKKGFNVDSKDIKLGSKEADEAVILGDSFMNQFKELLVAIKNLSSSLEELQDWPGGAPSPNILVPPLASALEAVTEEIISLIEDKKQPLLSKKINIE